MDKKALFTVAWAIAREAAARLGTAVRPQFASALKAAWAAARTGKETAMTDTDTDANEITAETLLRAALGPVEGMRAVWEAHRDRSDAHMLKLGGLYDYRTGRDAGLRSGMYESLDEFEGFIRAYVCRWFGVDASTLAHVVTPPASAPAPAVAAPVAPEPVAGFKAPVVVSRNCHGRNVWVAHVDGTDPTYGLSRVFLRKRFHNDPPHVAFCLPRPGYYEYRGVDTDIEGSVTDVVGSFFQVDARGALSRVSKAQVVRAVTGAA